MQIYSLGFRTASFALSFSNTGENDFGRVKKEQTKTTGLRSISILSFK